MVELTFPRSAKHGQRRVVTMWRDWNNLRKAVVSGDPVRVQEAFDECEPWIDWCFAVAANNTPSPDRVVCIEKRKGVEPR